MNKLYSMTGYAQTEIQIGGYQCIIELKALNGKQFDLFVKIPSVLKYAELQFRNLIRDELLRCSSELIIQLRFQGGGKAISINKDLLNFYIQTINEVSDNLAIEKNINLAQILSLPEVVSGDLEKIDESYIEEILKAIKNICDKLNKQRLHEGKMLKDILLQKIENISLANDAIGSYEKQRVEDKRNKLKAALQEFNADGKADENRFEQEIIFYIEKLDINEERERLKHHCEFFKSLIADDKEIQKGKKLTFTSQEIGREINTLGAKANHADIQKTVIQMKDDLEQIKEQLANVL